MQLLVEIGKQICLQKNIFYCVSSITTDMCFCVTIFIFQKTVITFCICVCETIYTDLNNSIFNSIQSNDILTQMRGINPKVHKKNLRNGKWVFKTEFICTISSWIMSDLLNDVIGIM